MKKPVSKPHKRSPEPIQLSRSDAGKHITLKKGENLVIQLTSNPTTGYDWLTIDLDSSILMEEPRTYQVLKDSLGSPSNLIIPYQAVHSGSTRILLQYQRRWEKDQPPADTFSVDIEIQDD